MLAGGAAGQVVADTGSRKYDFTRHREAFRREVFFIQRLELAFDVTPRSNADGSVCKLGVRYQMPLGASAAWPVFRDPLPASILSGAGAEVPVRNAQWRIIAQEHLILVRGDEFPAHIVVYVGDFGDKQERCCPTRAFHLESFAEQKIVLR